MSTADGPEAQTVYEIVGGGFFVDLVDRFYDGVAGDEVLRPMYPADLGGARARLSAFLIQFWGGPGTYSEQRGHPRLRRRHLPFRVDEQARDAWLAHMLGALDAAEAPDLVKDAMRDHFVRSADFLRNAE